MKEILSRSPWLVAIGAGIIMVATGLWAMVAPESFFDTVATFEPYNQHLLQDIGAFQLGLGAVLLIAALDRMGDALSAGLLGVGVGTAAHVVSHLVGRDLGGSPSTDIPFFAVLGGLLLAAGYARRRQLRDD